jgi:hypothetical protein
MSGMDKEGFALLYTATVEEAAHKAARDSAVVDAEDLEMDIWAELYAKFDEYSALEAKHVMWRIHRIARMAAAKERRDYEHFRGNFVYTTDSVKRILEESIWIEVDKAPDVDGRVDVKEAFGQLTENMQRALFKRHAMDEELTSAEKRSAQRAVERIADILNDSVSLEEVEVDTIGVHNGMAEAY